MVLRHFLWFLLGTVLMVLLGLLAWQWLQRGILGDRRAGPVAAAPVAAEPPFVPPQQPIEMKMSRGVEIENWKWVVGGLFGAACLFGEDGWWRLLAWPAGVVLLLIAAVSGFSAWSNRGTRLTADRQALKIDDRLSVRTIPWSRVARAVVDERSVREYESGSRRVYRKVLLLHDPDAVQLLELDLPLHPKAAYEDFLRSIPVWTGRPLETIER